MLPTAGDFSHLYPRGANLSKIIERVGQPRLSEILRREFSKWKENSFVLQLFKSSGDKPVELRWSLSPFSILR